MGGVIIGASLSEPHTSMTALQKCVCMLICLLAAIYSKFAFYFCHCLCFHYRGGWNISHDFPCGHVCYTHNTIIDIDCEK